MTDPDPKNMTIKDLAGASPAWINQHWKEVADVLSGREPLPDSLEGADNETLARASRSDETGRDRWPEVRAELQRRGDERAKQQAEARREADAKLAAAREQRKPEPVGLDYFDRHPEAGRQR